jgi:hypothetical protein
MTANIKKLNEILNDTPTVDWTKILIAGVYFVLVFAIIIIGQLMPMQKVMESIYGEIVITLLAPIATIIGFYFGASSTKNAIKSMVKVILNTD